MRIVLTGGGTGGHITPFEPIVEALRTSYRSQKDSLPSKIDPDKLEIWLFGVATATARELFSQIDVPILHIPSGKLRRYASFRTLVDIFFLLPVGLIKAFIYMWYLMPDVVVSKGGYGSVPVVIAAYFYRIPIILHESDSVPGVANRILGSVATVIALGMPSAKSSFKKYSKKVFVTGNPVRSDITAQANADLSKKQLGFNASDKVLVITGGSQGAKQINEILLKVLPTLITKTAILHIAGSEQEDAVRAVASELLEASSMRDRYKVVGYMKDMHIAYAAADAVVTRAGATTLAEVARVGKPCLIIPLDGAAGDHQRLNARIYEKHGAARVLDPLNLMPNLFERNVIDLLENEQLRESMKKNLREIDHPRAGRDMADFTLKLASGIVPVAG